MFYSMGELRARKTPVNKLQQVCLQAVQKLCSQCLFQADTVMIATALF